MQTIDLSHTIKRKKMMVYPGDPSVLIDEYLIHEQDYCHVDKININSHTGTHIDVPYHFIKNGKNTSDYSIENFIKPGIVIDITEKKENEEISISDFEKYDKKIIEECSIVIHTGWAKYFGTEKYLYHPYLGEDTAEYLAYKKVSIVALDTLSIDSTLDKVWNTHIALLSKEILIVENLNNLDKLNKDESYIFGFIPLKLENSDGSPIRAFAMK